MIPADLAPLIHQGDALELARKMPSESVQVIVTSPPYWRMRDYGVEGQWGLENTVEEFVDQLVVLFRELRRVLRRDGTCWVNIGDTYVGGGHGSRGTTSSVINGDQSKVVDSPEPYKRKKAPGSGIGLYDESNPETWSIPGGSRAAAGKLKRKDLALVPFRLAIALQDDGWWVREAIIWAKPNGIPEPSRGRPVHSHEYILLLAKSERYFYDGFAVRQPASEGTFRRMEAFVRNEEFFDPARHKHQEGTQSPIEVMASAAKTFNGTANLRSVWSIAMEPFGGDHFAPFPSEIPRRAILAGSSARGACAECGTPWPREVRAEGGLIGTDWFPDKSLTAGRVQGLPTIPPGYEQRDLGFVPGCECGAPVVPCVILDPFSGSGTTLQVARELGRRSVGFELNPAYHKISESRPGVGMPDILSWSARSGTDAGQVNGEVASEVIGATALTETRADETVTRHPPLPVVTLQRTLDWEASQ